AARAAPPPASTLFPYTTLFRSGLGRRPVLPGRPGAARPQPHLARPLLLRGAGAGLARPGLLRRGPAGGVAGVDLRQHQDRHLRPAASGVPDRGAPHVPLLRGERGAGLRGVAAAVAAGGVLGAVPGPPRARAAARLRLALAGGPAAACPLAAGAGALVAARPEAGDPRRAVPRPGLAAGDLRAVCPAEPAVLRRRRLPARPGAGARAVRRLLRQPAGGDGNARDPGPLRPAHRNAGGGLVRLRRDPAGGAGADRGRPGAGPGRLVGAGGGRVAGGAGAVGVPHRGDLPRAARRRAPGVTA